MESERTNRRRHKGIFGAIILILVGLVLLLEKNGIIDRAIIVQWWPLLLIFIGGWLLISRLNRKND